MQQRALTGGPIFVTPSSRARVVSLFLFIGNKGCVARSDGPPGGPRGPRVFD